MSADHDHEPEPIPGLPKALPPGETLLWSGSPAFKPLARRAFHLRGLALYFGVFLLSRGLATASSGQGALQSVIAALWVLPLAVLGLSLVAFIAWLTAKTTVYTITSKRVVMRFGIALPMSFNFPFRRLAAADLKAFPEGDGEIALRLSGPSRLAWLNLWPHVRPWRVALAEPMMRGLPEVAKVAAILASAVSQRPLSGAAIGAQPPAQAVTVASKVIAA